MLDPTLQPSILYVEGGIYNFAHIKIEQGSDGNMHLLADIVGEDGVPRPNSHIDLVPQESVLDNITSR